MIWNCSHINNALRHFFSISNAAPASFLIIQYLRIVEHYSCEIYIWIASVCTYQERRRLYKVSCYRISRLIPSSYSLCFHLNLLHFLQATRSRLVTGSKQWWCKLICAHASFSFVVHYTSVKYNDCILHSCVVLHSEDLHTDSRRGYTPVQYHLVLKLCNFLITGLHLCWTEFALKVTHFRSCLDRL